MTYKEDCITFMVRSGVLTFGDFTTKSGRKTPYFVNTGNYKTGAQAARLGDAAAKRVENYLRCSAEELKTFARITGNPDIHGLSVDDLCTISREISEHTDIPHAGKAR